MMPTINKKDIKYSKYYVAYLDVLGFKDLVFSKLKKDKNTIEIYFAIIESVTSKLKKIKRKQKLGSIVISDSVILSVPHGFNLRENIHNLRQLCLAVGIIQLALARRNIWLRGGITSGNAYFNPDENAIVGPAYINAYLLEGKAIYPRVILDNNIVGLLEKSSVQDLIDEINNKGEGGLDYLNWSGNILFDWGDTPLINANLNRDIPLFIDYMCHLLMRSKRSLDDMLDNIESNIYSNNVLYGKYRWIVDYLLVSSERLIHKEGRNDLVSFFERLKRY